MGLFRDQMPLAWGSTIAVLLHEKTEHHHPAPGVVVCEMRRIVRSKDKAEVEQSTQGQQNQLAERFMLGCHVPGRAGPFQECGSLQAEKVNSNPASRFVSSHSCSTNGQQLAQGIGVGIVYDKTTREPGTVYQIGRSLLRNPDWWHRSAVVKHDIHLAG
jgi:hypothetical protein